MQKENGMLKPADKQEVAGIKGKKFHCVACNQVQSYESSTFSNMVCPKCGGALMEEGQGTESGKATGGYLKWHSLDLARLFGLLFVV